MIQNVFELLSQLNGPQISHNQRLKIEYELQNIQRDSNILSIVPAMIESNNLMMQFFAAQTLYWHFRERWCDLNIYLVEFFKGKLFIWVFEGSTLPPAIRKKLIQALTIFIINTFTNDEQIEDLFKRPVNEILFLVMAELPNELDRFTTLSTSQYSFKHLLSTKSSFIVKLLCDHFFSLDFGIVSQVITSWLGLEPFRKQSLPSIIPLLFTAIQRKDLLQESVGILITWFESGVESYNLLPLIPNILSLRELIHNCVRSGDFDSANSISKVFRLYGELIIDSLVAFANDGSREFLNVMVAFTGIEYQLLTPPPVADVSLFWSSLCDAISAQDQNNEALQFLTMAWDAILSQLSQIPIDASYYPYRESLEEVILRIYCVLGDSRISYLASIIKTNPPNSRIVDVAIWCFGVVCEALYLENETAKQFIRNVLEIQNQLFDLKTALSILKKVKEFILYDKEVLMSVASFIFSLMENGSIVSKNAIEVLAEIMDPSLDERIISCSALITRMTEEQLLAFWPLLCEAVGRSVDKASLIDNMCSLVAPLYSNNSLKLALILTDFMVTSCNLGELNSAPPSYKHLLEVGVNSYSDQVVEDYKKLCISVMEVFGLKSPNETVALMERPLNSILDPLKLDIVPVLETLIIICPHFAPNLAQKIESILVNRALFDDEVWQAILPVLIRCVKSGAKFANSAMERFVNRLAMVGETVTDELLTLASRLVISSLSNISVEDKMSIFRLLLEACKKNLTDTQVDIIAPCMLQLLQCDPMRMGQIVGTALSLTPASQDTLVKLKGCRMPRLFGKLLLQLCRKK